jgi:glutaminyl-tRNA synthetase
MRRRGITPEAIRAFLEMVGVAKADSRVDLGKLEYAIRDHLNRTVPRVMAVLDPLKVVITNHPDGDEELEVPSYPHDVPLEGSRPVPFAREIYIEREDFEEHPPAGFFRLSPGREVRLRHAYFIRCEEVVRDPETDEVVELRCTYDPETRGGSAPDGRKVKGTIHWVSAAHSLPAEIRLYDRLFSRPDPERISRAEGDEDEANLEDFLHHLNPDSRVVVHAARVEPSVSADPPGTRYQFERKGYFVSDSEDSGPGSLVFNRIVTLRDSWRVKGDSRVPVTPRSGFTRGAAADGDETSAPAAGPVSAESPQESRDRRNPGQDARDRARRKHPELADRRDRYIEEWELPEDHAELLSGSREVSDLFEEALARHANAPALANWIVNELLPGARGRSLGELPVKASGLADLVRLLDEETISHSVAREVFAEMIRSGGDPTALVADQAFQKTENPEVLVPLMERVLDAFPDKVEEYRRGKTGLLGFFTGKILQESQGRADPRAVQALLRERLG